MRVVVQRVKSSRVRIEGKIHSEIGAGLMLLLGIESDDTQEDIDWLVNKIIGLRIFSDDQGKMNLSLLDIGGNLQVVSQFTLHASVKKGTRPSFVKAAHPEVAIPLYESFVEKSRKVLKKDIATGVFGAMMQIELVNDGPVTIIIDSKNKSL